jgi:integrase
LGKSPELCTSEDANNYLKYLLLDGNSHTTVNHKKTTLKSLYEWCVKEKYLKKNPFENIKKLAENKQSKMFFTSAEIAMIKNYLTATTPEVWMACQFLYYCFIRPNELRQLKSKDIDFNRMKITVPGLVAKNKKTQTVEIPLPFQHEIKNNFGHKAPGEYLLGNGKEILPANKIAKIFRDCLNALGFDNRYSLYSFKHTGVVMFYTATKDIKATQLQLRHSSLDVVNEYLKNLGCFDNDSVRNNFPAI